MKISIITPVYNREDTLLRCLESVTAALSDKIEVEHIVVDDGSTDTSAEIASEYSRSHDYITFFKFPTNRGVAAARNVAIAAATGDYCIWLDSDDTLDSHALDNINNAVQKYPGRSYYLFLCDSNMSNTNGTESGHTYTFYDFLSGKLTGDFSHMVSSRIMKKYPFDEQLRVFESFNFLKFQREAKEMTYVANIITHIEINRNDSVSLTYIRTNTEVIRRKLRFAEMTIEEFGADYKALNLDNTLNCFYLEAADNALLLGDYNKTKKYLGHTQPGLKRHILSMIAALHAGHTYRHILQFMLTIKHKRPTRGVH